MPKRKSWNDKLNGAKPPHVTVLEKPFAGVPAGARLFIASPVLIKSYVERIPFGETRSVPGMRRDLAAENGATATCPASSSIFLRIVAEAAWEDHQAGKPASQITPFWRIIEPGGDLAKRLTCGSDFIATMRAAEIQSRQSAAA